ncbi:histidinol dehydrogenase [Richelia intracellularis]|jgi:histidinol dehydrogenase|nr:histidinol dehydrogenase [Richelia intracellularis]HAE05779.1 hypothetical protein [Richelia sp.]
MEKPSVLGKIIHPVMLVVDQQVGIREIYQGVHAIAALAYEIQNIPK